MNLTNGQKKVISNIFRDLTKLTVAALILGQFVPGQGFDLIGFLGGLTASLCLMFVAIIFAVSEKKGVD